eukprot:CAMPEP_0171957780 /NCGR_PEP_ID=MMETSP0993-20121228/134126_1 /TAXON_ID=483369 /ORGANISM="non described non described, Strain CCMP2098" /LENGTH=102 /DNA_ID=CAMNT_0012604761 /DNA_START=720 /DNA_END=1028 /DNA_ORIENTATION=-
MERGGAHKAVDAGLELEPPKGVTPFNFERGISHSVARCPRHSVNGLTRPSFPRAQTAVHSQQHRYPVLGVGASCPCNYLHKTPRNLSSPLHDGDHVEIIYFH